MDNAHQSVELPGRVLGMGVDIIECCRIAEMIEKHGDYFLTRVYTPEEIAYCAPRKAAVQHYAGRWAAKEAILKALGTGWAKGIKWTDLEIANLPGGKPEVNLHGMAQRHAKSIGIREVLISISHTSEQAVASAIAIS